MDRIDTDLTLILPRDTYYQTIHGLRAALPPPVTDAPEDRIRRDNAAMAAVAAMLPANGDETVLAVQYVAAAAHALDALRLGCGAPPDSQTALRCNAQAASMMRQAACARALLLRIQAARLKREADHAALDRAAWTEHAALHLMAEALGRPSPAPLAQPPPLLDPEPDAVAPEQPGARAPGEAGACRRSSPHDVADAGDQPATETKGPAARRAGTGSSRDGAPPVDAPLPPRPATAEPRAGLLARVTEPLAQRDTAAGRLPNGEVAAVLPVHGAGPPPAGDRRLAAG